MNRQEANRHILARIASEIESSPDQRFSQILRNLDIITEYRNKEGMPEYWVNEFNLEPHHILARMPWPKDEG